MKRTKKDRSTLGTVTIMSEKEVPYVELQVDMDEATCYKLAQAGWQEIQYDREALINYAFSKALKEFCDGHAGRAR